MAAIQGCERWSPPVRAAGWAMRTLLDTLRRGSGRLSLGAVLLLAGCRAAPAEAPPPATQAAGPITPTKVAMAWPAVVGSVAPVWLAKEGGYFAEAGLDVDLEYIAGSPKALAALVSGNVQFAAAPGPAVVAADVNGANAVLVMAWVNEPAFVVMTAPEITTPEQLRGKTIAVSSLGASDDFMLREALRHWGLQPDTDVHITALGPQSGVPALEQRLVHGMVANPPNDVRARQVGAHRLARIADFGIPYLGSGLATTREYLQTQRSTVSRVVQAVTRGVHRFKTDSAFAKQVLSTYLQNTDAEVLDGAYSAYVDVFPRVPLPTLAAMQQSAKEAMASHDAAGTIDIAPMWDASFVEALQQSGWTDQLYGN
jgi:ABC-type nitrate/sulfonate/bicarbonate transport system substrate-binding protein